MGFKRDRKIDMWLVDEKDDPATFPAWLTATVKARFEDGLFVQTTDAGVIEARPGDVIAIDGEGRIAVYIKQEIGKPRQS